jgi:AcrR family transcriptional regulator
MTEAPAEHRKTRKELLSELRHQEVVESARHIFARLGYEATNVEEIAREAGMAKGTIYLYFKSKEDVFAAVIASDLQTLTEKTIQGMSAAKTFDEQLRVFLNLRKEYMQHNQDFLRIYFAEFGSRGSRTKLSSEAIDALYWRGVEFMHQCLRQAIERGELRQVPVESATFAIFDVAKGFGERHLRNWANLTMEEDLAFTHSFILKGLAK